MEDSFSLQETHWYLHHHDHASLNLGCKKTVLTYVAAKLHFTGDGKEMTPDDDIMTVVWEQP